MQLMFHASILVTGNSFYLLFPGPTLEIGKEHVTKIRFALSYRLEKEMTLDIWTLQADELTGDLVVCQSALRSTTIICAI